MSESSIGHTDATIVSGPYKEIIKKLMGMDPAEAAHLIDRALDRPDVREEFRKRLPDHGKSWGNRDDHLVHATPWYNAPTACVAAVTRLNDGEWELLVGRRHKERGGHQTLLGGYFAPYLPKECNKLFEMAENYAHQREIAESERYSGLLEVPPTTLEEDVRSRDTDLEATVRKELFQEAGIFLVPKEISPDEKETLAAAVHEASDQMIARGEREKPIIITEDYDIIERVLPYSGVGTAEPTRQICSMGFVVVLHGNGEFNELQPGDDIAEVQWVPQSRLSTEISPENKEADDSTVYIGDMRDGDPEIIEHAFRALISDVDICIKAKDGSGAYSAKAEQLIVKIDRICDGFGLTRSDILGEFPDPPIGPDAAQHHRRMVEFMQRHHTLVVEPFEQGTLASLEELFMAERNLLSRAAKFAANPEKVINATTSAHYKKYRSQSISRMAVGLLPTEAQEPTGRIAPRERSDSFVDTVSACSGGKSARFY